MTPADYAPIAEAIAAHLTGMAPPKVEGGSPARAQWLSDVMAVEVAFHKVGAMEVFIHAMNADPDPEPVQ